MNLVAGSIGEIIKIVLALGLVYFTVYLQRGVRRGIMETPFKLIAISIVAFTLAQVFGLISEFSSYGNIADLLHDGFGICFILIAFLGFYKLYKVWHVEIPPSKIETDKPSIPDLAV